MVIFVKTIGVGEFKQHCLRLLEELRRTRQPLLITKRGRPIAQVVPPPAELEPTSWRGCMRDRGTILADLLEPAVEPEEWDALRR
jgi:prevent-host-death family protein